MSFIPDVRRLPSNLISDIRRVLSRLRSAITICPTMSNIGFRTMLGLPPAIPTRTIKTKIGRKSCSIAPSAEFASVIVSPPVTAESQNTMHAAPISSANSTGDVLVLYSGWTKFEDWETPAVVLWVSSHGDACPRGQSFELVTALFSECGPWRDSYCSWVFRFLR